jgi:hypothetical protein
LEEALQSPPTSQRIGISTTCTGGHQTEVNSHILTLDVDTYVGQVSRITHLASVDDVRASSQTEVEQRQKQEQVVTE